MCTCGGPSQAAVPNEIVVPGEVFEADQEVERERNIGLVKELPHEEKPGLRETNRSSSLVESFFVRTVKAGSIRVEYEDLALAGM